MPEAFSHPAKFAPGLIKRILRHGLEQGYWQKNDVIGDPFGGIGCGGIMAAPMGLNWIGVELEEKFVRLSKGYDCPGLTKKEWVRWLNRQGRNKDLCPACQGNPLSDLYGGHGKIPEVEAHYFAGNFTLYGRNWEIMGYPVPQIIQGDSRNFAEIINGAMGIVTSPPYAESLSVGGNPQNPSLATSIKNPKGRTHHDIEGDEDYGTNPSNIGNLKAGDLQAVVTSPPYVNSMEHIGGIDPEKSKYNYGPNSQMNKSDTRYGQTPGQIARLKEGKIDGIVTSPPYEDSINSKTAGKGIDWEKAGRPDRCKPSDKRHYPVVEGEFKYGDQPGQIGKDSGETYWQAMAAVYTQCHIALRPGGVIAIVIKDYVKNKARVPLRDQTWDLLLKLGFRPLERIRAMLVEEMPQKGLFGQPHKIKARKSFFRRLAESKGSPPIDWEEVLICRK